MMGDVENYYPTLAYDGYALLVRSAFDFNSPLKAIDFDGSELWSWELKVMVLKSINVLLLITVKIGGGTIFHQWDNEQEHIIYFMN